MTKKFLKEWGQPCTNDTYRQVVQRALDGGKPIERYGTLVRVGGLWVGVPNPLGMQQRASESVLRVFPSASPATGSPGCRRGARRAHRSNSISIYRESWCVDL